MKRLFFILLAIVVLAACSKGDDTPKDPDEPKPPVVGTGLTWEKKTNCGMSMTSYFAYNIGDEIYYINHNGQMWAYHIPSDKWTQCRTSPAGSSCALVYKGNLYCRVGDSGNPDYEHYFKKYDSANNNWLDDDGGTGPKIYGSVINSYKDILLYFFTIDDEIYLLVKTHRGTTALWRAENEKWVWLADLGYTEGQPMGIIGDKAYYFRYFNNRSVLVELYPKITTQWTDKLEIGVQASIFFPYKNYVFVFNRYYSFDCEIINLTTNEKEKKNYLLPNFKENSSQIDGVDITPENIRAINVKDRVFMGPINASFYEMKLK